MDPDSGNIEWEQGDTEKIKDLIYREDNIPDVEPIAEDDASIVEEELSDHMSVNNSFKFRRGLALNIDILKESIRFTVTDDIGIHVQIPTIISFRDLCIETYGIQNIEEESKHTTRHLWDDILKEDCISDSKNSDFKDLNENIKENASTKITDVNGNIKNCNNEEDYNEEKTYEDVTSFLNTIKSRNKNKIQSSTDNALRRRVQDMSARLTKQGLLCDPRDYYFNPMTMTSGNAGARSREDYYDVFDDFIDDSDLVDDLGLSLEELYDRYDNKIDNDESSANTSTRTSELIHVEYSQPTDFICDNNPMNDYSQNYDGASTSSLGSILYDDENQVNYSIDSYVNLEKKENWTLKDILNNPVAKLLIQIRSDCWNYSSKKNKSGNSGTNKGANSINSTTGNISKSNIPVSIQDSPKMTLNNTPLLQCTDLSSSSLPQQSVNCNTSNLNDGIYSFPNRTPKMVIQWFKVLEEKLKTFQRAYKDCKDYYNKNGNVKCDKITTFHELHEPISIINSNIERDPILCRIPSLFSSIYTDYSEVAPYDFKLIQILWDALYICLPLNLKKKQTHGAFGSNGISTTILNLLQKFDNFRSKWARLILSHNKEALYQFNFNAYEAIKTYPCIKMKSPEYIKRILDAISVYNSAISNNSNNLLKGGVNTIVLSSLSNSKEIKNNETHSSINKSKFCEHESQMNTLSTDSTLNLNLECSKLYELEINDSQKFESSIKNSENTLECNLNYEENSDNQLEKIENTLSLHNLQKLQNFQINDNSSRYQVTCSFISEDNKVNNEVTQNQMRDSGVKDTPATPRYYSTADGNNTETSQYDITTQDDIVASLNDTKPESSINTQHRSMCSSEFEHILDTPIKRSTNKVKLGVEKCNHEESNLLCTQPASLPIKEEGQSCLKTIPCDLVFDFGIALLDYIYGINKLRNVYKDLTSANVLLKTVQREQETIPANGIKGLESMIRTYILKRFQGIQYNGQKLKDIPYRFFLNQVRLLQNKYNYRRATDKAIQKVTKNNTDLIPEKDLKSQDLLQDQNLMSSNSTFDITLQISDKFFEDITRTPSKKRSRKSAINNDTNSNSLNYDISQTEPAGIHSLQNENDRSSSIALKDSTEKIKKPRNKRNKKIVVEDCKDILLNNTSINKESMDINVSSDLMEQTNLE
ncbi:hypothetical protein cand_001540 [Cryptosporidium andersoni]|uniref:Hpc2-related domain-containing protein n=1 Tax=Cryptosporidium andersoni TaxID=117008 RepID=A0A1J4MQY4_9CRYT|nr:hypothetical protein cand_001540 [Cryptosporidium andersoni]